MRRGPRAPSGSGCSSARPPCVIGSLVLAFWVFCALFPGLVAPYDPIFDNQFPTSPRPSGDIPFGTDTNGRDIFSRVLAGSRSILVIAPAATLIGTVLGTALGLVTGYFRGVRRRRHQPARRRGPGAASDRDGHPHRDRGRTHGQVGRHAHHRADLRPGHLTHRSRGRARRDGARLRPGSAAPR